MKKDTPLKEQFKIVVSLCAAIIAFILVLTGSDVYIKSFNFHRWLEIIFNILSFVFAIQTAGIFLNYYWNSKSDDDKKNDIK